MAEINAERSRKLATAATATKPLPNKPKRERMRFGYVYFLRAGNVVKIGFSTSPRERQHTLRTGSAVRSFICKVMLGTSKLPMLSGKHIGAGADPRQASRQISN